MDKKNNVIINKLLKKNNCNNIISYKLIINLGYIIIIINKN